MLNIVFTFVKLITVIDDGILILRKRWKGESGCDRHPVPPELRHVGTGLCKVQGS